MNLAQTGKKFWLLIYQNKQIMKKVKFCATQLNTVIIFQLLRILRIMLPQLTYKITVIALHHNILSTHQFVSVVTAPSL